MPEAFSFNREFDFVRLDGLRRATGLPPHEWDLYIVKELIDNALDADEALWQADRRQWPRVEIRMEYISIPARRAQQLLIQVSNRAVFPVEQLADIFATQWYTSRKAFLKGLTRGALGNALKTLLGIPYALRHRVASDWQPELKPLSMRCQDQEYLPRYVIDATAQTIHFECETKTRKSVAGTMVRIGLDHFEQEQPRTLTQLTYLAEQYHLCNPHTEFRWTVELGDQEWLKVYEANPTWADKFQGLAPVQWYPPATFQEVLGALYRRANNDVETGQLSITTACRYFAGFNADPRPDAMTTIIEGFGSDSLTTADIDSPVATCLYQVLCRHSLPVASERLGRIGPEHIRTVLTETLPVEGEVFYESATDSGDDPEIPFVIEAAIVRLKEGKRQIWTALNFTPTYSDPFFRRRLRAPVQPDEPVLGLRGLLNIYGISDDEPALLFLHLICPNIEHHEFSKTEINHLPFKQALGEVIDRLLQTLRQAQQEAELRLEQTVFQVLEAILSELAETERFVFDQLLARLQARLKLDPALADWLERTEAPARLRAFITAYQSRNTVLTQHVARPTVGTISLPLHPDRHFSILAEHLSPELLAQHHVNKILYVQGRELEAVIIENGWLCQLDMALLHNTPTSDTLRIALVQAIVNSHVSVPILVWHDADSVGQAIVEQIRTWLAERQLDAERIIDLGLQTVGLDQTSHSTRLVELMPGELLNWLTTHLVGLGVPIKSLPPQADIRRDIRRQFEQRLQGYLWEGVSHQLQVTRLLNDLDQQLNIAGTMSAETLDDRLKQRLEQSACVDSYALVLKDVVEGFFEAFMQVHSVKIRELVRAHLTQIRDGGEG
jgi:hypothetical protein